MTTELSYRNEGANVYAQNGALVCIAVDPLDAEVIAGLLRWKVDIHPEPAPEPDRTDVPALVDALRAVLDLHREYPGRPNYCRECVTYTQPPAHVAYPCRTVRAIEEALNA